MDNLRIDLGPAHGWVIEDNGTSLVKHGLAAVPSLAYVGLQTIDARGTVVSSKLQIAHGTVQIIVQPPRTAAYPIDIDPTWVTTSTPTATLSTSNGGSSGYAVALSSDGTTALVGAINASSGDGAAFIFHVSTEGSWATSTTPVATLTNATDTSDDQFGYAVALSNDGTTAFVGVPFESSGSVDVYHVSNESSWASSSAPTATLSDSSLSLASSLGSAIALSSDGTTAVIGAPGVGADIGAALVYHGAGEGSWTTTATPMATLSNSSNATADEFGVSTALSSDGTTVVIGTYDDASGPGVAYVFHAANETAWANATSPNATLTVAGNPDGAGLGLSVALSSDGTVAVIGAYGALAAYIFKVTSETSWVTTSSPTATLTNSPATSNGGFGEMVAMSAGGTTVVVGAPEVKLDTGAASVFQVSGEGAWATTSTPTANLSNASSAMKDYFGNALAVSADGTTALIGAAGANSGAGASYVFSASSTPPSPPPPPSHGYWLVGSDGGIFTFGSATFHGSTGNLKLQRPVVGITPTATDGGYWLVATDGGIFAFGNTQFYGSLPGLGYAPAGSTAPKRLNAPIVAMVPSIDDDGYFMVASDGGVFAFGDATFAGSCPGIGGCSGAAVAVMPDSTGNGYWLVTQTGNIYSFGDAVAYGEPGPQSAPVTSAVRTPDGKGYWILLSNGSVFAYGDAASLGGPSGLVGGANPATAIFTTSDGGGYWVASANGSVFAFGDAPYDGGMNGTALNGSIIAATGF